MKRMIDTGTWDDPWFAELEPDAKLVFLYLLTNRRSTAAGAFEITTRAMSFETGIDQKRIAAILDILSSRVQWWPEYQIIWVRKFFKHQAANDNFTKSAQGVVKELPRDVQCAIGVLYPSLVPEGVVCPDTTGTDTHPNGYATGTDTPNSLNSGQIPEGDARNTTSGSDSDVEKRKADNHAESGTRPNGYATGTDTPSAVIDIERDIDIGEDRGVDGADAPNPKPRAKRATQVPDDFALSDNLVKWGTDPKQGYTVEQMESQVPRFIDHYTAKGEPRKDWDASFRTWMRNARDFGHLNRTSLTVHQGGNAAPNPNKRGGYTAGELMQLAEMERRRESS